MSGEKQVIKYKTTCFPSYTYVTEDHQHFVGCLDTCSSSTISSYGFKKILSRKSKTIPKSDKTKWMKIGDVQNGVMLFPLNIKWEIKDNFVIDMNVFSIKKNYMSQYIDKIAPSYDLGYMFGMFIGDGCAAYSFDSNRKSVRGSVSWYLGKDDYSVKKLVDSIKKVTGKDAKQSFIRGMNVIRLYSIQWARFLKAFGKRKNKHLPAQYIVNNREYMKGILDGLIDSDGHIDNNGRIIFANTSVRTIELFNLIYFYINNTLPNFECTKRCNSKITKKETVIYLGRPLLKPNNRKIDDFHIVKILDIDKGGCGIVPTYDIEIDDETHSFIANNVIVHNSTCSTRIMTGCGVPQASAIVDVCMGLEIGGFRNKGLKDRYVSVISDGGVKYFGDIVKACALGADTVMIGRLFAGTPETPGEIIRKGISVQKQFKIYAGMASVDSQIKRDPGLSINDILQEGVTTTVPYISDSAADIVRKMGMALQVGMSYVGARNIEELRSRAIFMQVTGNGMVEAMPRED